MGIHFWYGLVHSWIVTAVSILTTFSIGLFGLTGSGGFPVLSAVSSGSSITVLAAAPLNSTRIVPLNFGLTSRTAPPEYRKTASEKSQSSQFNPSKGWRDGPFRRALTNGGPRPGTTGSLASFIPIGRDGPVGGAEVCARVTVWILKNSDPNSSPTANDPNAKVILDITPPISGKAGNCFVWEYRYGKPPPLKPTLPRKQQPIIPPKYRKGVAWNT